MPELTLTFLPCTFWATSDRHQSQNVYAHTRTMTCKRTRVHNIHTREHTHAHARTHARTHCMHARTHARTHACTHAHAHAHTHTHTLTLSHTHGGILFVDGVSLHLLALHLLYVLVGKRRQVVAVYLFLYITEFIKKAQEATCSSLFFLS